MLAHSEQTKGGIWLASLDGGERRQILQLERPQGGRAANTVLVATDPMASGEGYLVYSRQGSLLAQAYDLSRNQLTGEPLRLAEQVEETGRVGSGPPRARFSVANGVIVMLEPNDSRQLTWFDGAGRRLGTVGAAGSYRHPTLSPNDQLLAVEKTDQQTRTRDILLFDLARNTEMRFTVDPGRDENPIWSPDGSRLVWTSSRGDGRGLNLYAKAANGSGPDEMLLTVPGIQRSTDWSPDGRFILYQQSDASAWDIWVLPLEGERKPWPWLKTEFEEGQARFSPDGKWIAYRSLESGRPEVYLQAFVPGSPASGARQKLSTNGGELPAWRRDGRELYYLADNKLMAVDMTLGSTPKAGPPKELFAMNGGRQYTVTGDGQRFLAVTDPEGSSSVQFTVLLNWMTGLKK